LTIRDPRENFSANRPIPMSPARKPEPVVDVAKRILAARATEVALYAQLYPLLLMEMDEIMAEWDRNTAELPWSALEEADRKTNLVGVITRVIDCAMSGAPRAERVRALVDAATRHGESRRKQGVDVSSIFREYFIVRTATWRQLKTLVAPPTSYDAIFVIDGLLSIASRGTVLGYHRKEMEANGLWEAHRAELEKSVRS
jgi:hypothetical protein